MNIIDKIQIGLINAKGGGGSSSGKVSHSAYLETIHNDWLDNTGVDTITSSMTDVMDTAQGASPWAAQVAYDPDTAITAMTDSVAALQTMVTLLSNGTTLDTLIADILDDARIDTVVDEYAADLDARLAAEVLPRFRRGMQDINAVVSSAFVIGAALIEVGQDRQVAKFSADIHNKAASDDALKVIELKLNYQQIATHAIAEINRIKIVAKKEENEVAMTIDNKDAIWDMEVFQFGSNLLAGIGGGTLVPGSGGPSTAQSVIGGAISGAASGAMIAGASSGAIAGPVGMGVGAFLGAASGLL